jgi:mannose-6-phosphate isomerase-like protein (cupin superfamily)
MLAVIDIKAELSKLTLQGLSPQSAAVARSASFAKLATFRDGGLFSAKLSGETPWERHPNGDELVYIVDGAATFHIMTPEGPQSLALNAGTLLVVPRGQWHRFESPDGVGLITATPLPTEHAAALPALE